jgi:hypothetical protein
VTSRARACTHTDIANDHAGVQVIQQPLLTSGAVTTVRLRTRLDHLCSSNGAPGEMERGHNVRELLQSSYARLLTNSLRGVEVRGSE